jgi:hypothetical protein
MRSRVQVLPAIALPPYACARCGYACDAASGVGSAPSAIPAEGSVSLCIRCGLLAIFTGGADPVLRAPTEQERRNIESDPELSRIRAALAQAIAERPS